MYTYTLLYYNKQKRHSEGSGTPELTRGRRCGHMRGGAAGVSLRTGGRGGGWLETDPTDRRTPSVAET